MRGGEQWTQGYRPNAVPKKCRLPKRHKVYEYMEQHAIVSQCRLEGLAQHIKSALTSRVPNTPLQDTETAVQAIRQLAAN